MLGRWRFSIGGLMAGVALAAIGLWAFRTGTESAFRTFYTLMIGVLLVATLAAWLAAEGRRAFWVGFALFGWASLLIGLGVSPEQQPAAMGRGWETRVNAFLLSTPWLERAHRLLKPPRHIGELGAYPFAAPIGHLLLTLALAVLGGGLALIFPGTRQNPAAPFSDIPRASTPRTRRRARVAGGVAGGVVLVLLLVLAARWYTAAPPGPYFPELVFSPVKRKHDARAAWYGKHLERMGEPSLWKLAESGRDQAVFRLLWIPNDGAPAAVRIARSGESIRLTAVVLGNRPGGEPGTIAITAEESLDPDEWEEFLELIERADYWNFPTTTPLEKTEHADTAAALFSADEPWNRVASRAILEAVSPGRYHVVERTFPNPGMFEYLCKRLLELGEIEGDGNMAGDPGFP